MFSKQESFLLQTIMSSLRVFFTKQSRHQPMINQFIAEIHTRILLFWMETKKDEKYSSFFLCVCGKLHTLLDLVLTLQSEI